MAHARLAVDANELVAHVAEEVRLANLLVQLAGVEVQAVVSYHGAVLASRDRAGVEHRAQHRLAASACSARICERVVPRRRLRQSGKERRLRELELLGRLGEVGLRCGLHAVGLAAVVDLIQIGRQDLLLRPLVGELHCEAGLTQLAGEGSLARDVEVAHELLRDRRTALHDLALADVGPEGTRDADGVDPAVLPVALVLDRDSRLDDPGADLVPGNLLPVPSLGGNGAEA